MAIDLPHSEKQPKADSKMALPIEASAMRTSGQWKDQVAIAADFDTLPDELQSYFNENCHSKDMDDAIALRTAQAAFAKLAPPDVLLSEEIIRERREEAKREED